MKLVVDSREQAPFTFAAKRYAGLVIERGSLVTGDYSLAGLGDRVAVERKSLDDLILCLGKERERFERELSRARGLEYFAVVVEAAWEDVAKGNYKSKFQPHAACQSVLAFMVRWGIPFFFAGSRPAAEYVTYSLLEKYLEGSRKRLAAIIKEHDAA